MADSAQPVADLKLHLGILDIGISNMPLRGKRQRVAPRGPYLIVDRFKGLALDTKHRRTPGSEPIMWSPNGGEAQLWWIDQVSGSREYTITSVQTGLRLDAGERLDLSRSPTMSEPHGLSQQQWGFVPGLEGIGCLIVSLRSGHVLDFPQLIDRDEPPHMYARNDELQQQFLLLRMASVDQQDQDPRTRP